MFYWIAMRFGVIWNAVSSRIHHKVILVLVSHNEVRKKWIGKSIFHTPRIIVTSKSVLVTPSVMPHWTIPHRLCPLLRILPPSHVLHVVVCLNFYAMFNISLFWYMRVQDVNDVINLQGHVEFAVWYCYARYTFRCHIVYCFQASSTERDGTNDVGVSINQIYTTKFWYTSVSHYWDTCKFKGNISLLLTKWRNLRIADARIYRYIQIYADVKAEIICSTFIRHIVVCENVVQIVRRPMVTGHRGMSFCP